MQRINIGVTSPLMDGEAITGDLEIVGHCNALRRAGAEPVVLRNDMDPLRVVQDFQLRGIVFSGGGDLDATRYGGDASLANDRFDPRRDAFDFPLMEHVLKIGCPVLAVCRGMQVANVLLGGTLIEDLQSHLGAEYRVFHHQRKDIGRARNDYAHDVALVAETMLHGILANERIPVNSFHHQAIRVVAPALRVSAWADDGIVEALEFSSDNPSATVRPRFFLGIQWHPELLIEDRFSQLLYTRFVQACEAE